MTTMSVAAAAERPLLPISTGQYVWEGVKPRAMVGAGTGAVVGAAVGLLGAAKVPGGPGLGIALTTAGLGMGIGAVAGAAYTAVDGAIMGSVLALMTPKEGDDLRNTGAIAGAISGVTLGAFSSAATQRGGLGKLVVTGAVGAAFGLWTGSNLEKKLG